MSENTAKITDPIWDSRNSDEPPVSDLDTAHRLERIWIEREMELDRLWTKYATGGNASHCRIVAIEMITLKRCRLDLQEAFGLTIPT